MARIGPRTLPDERVVTGVGGTSRPAGGGAISPVGRSVSGGVGSEGSIGDVVLR
jgi:hypothetical protein